MKKVIFFALLLAMPVQAAAPQYKQLTREQVSKINCSMVAYLNDDIVKSEAYLNGLSKETGVHAAVFYRTRKGVVDFVNQYPKYVKNYAEFCGLPVPKGFENKY